MKGTGELWNMSDDELKAQAAQNSEAWHTAETQEEKDGYHAENTEINKILDSRTGETTTFDPDSGTWSPRKEPSAGGTAGQRETGKADTFTYDSAPEYLSKNQEMIDAAYEKIMGRPAFSYDPETDPAYQQYKDQYTRQGKLAMEDALGQVSARTGGLASSYAGSAAQQSYNQYMSALGDKIPELRQLAYEMYRDEGDDMRADLNMLLNKEQMDYGRYQDRLGQYNADRSFAYGVERDKVADDQWKQSFDYGVERDKVADDQWKQSFDYQAGRDQVDDQWRQTEWDYGVQQDALAREDQDRQEAVSRIDTYLQAGGAVDGIPPELLEQSGFSLAEVNARADYYGKLKNQEFAVGSQVKGSGGGPKVGSPTSNDDSQIGLTYWDLGERARGLSDELNRRYKDPAYGAELAKAIEEGIADGSIQENEGELLVERWQRLNGRI